MEKDLANQKSLLKIIKCLILDEKGKQSFLDSNGMKAFYQKIKSLPSGNLIEKNKNKKKIIELYLMMIDITRSCLPKTSLPHLSSLKTWKFFEASKLKLKSIDKDMNIKLIAPPRNDIVNSNSNSNSNSSNNENNNNHSHNNINNESSSFSNIYNITKNPYFYNILYHINENISSLYTLQKEIENDIESFNIDKKDLLQFFPELNPPPEVPLK
ncbi:hypothetical protein PIROE2DRAFT_16928 [Piromyces sp. E2]|nr:hypothetical protein PIROE2DRAFT_16928 [Piromyces sp. E2]|eukprot:OUM57932.1 hypothetical protein PIROE2DRAFT_16928 [Piromyces sp. E2]